MTPLSGITPIMSNLDLARSGEIAPGRLAGLEGPEKLDQALGTTATSAPSETTFASMLGKMVQDVNSKQFAAADAVNGLQSGQNVPLHQAVIAME